MLGDGERWRAVEGEGGRRGGAAGGGEPVARLDGGQRVEAQLPELPIRGDLVRRAEAEHGGDVDPDQLGERLLPVVVAEPGQLARERVTARTGGGAAPARAD